jgi:hypothetical protein
MVKKRITLQVSPLFINKLKELQKTMMRNGDLISLRDLTEHISKTKALQELEDSLIKKTTIGIKFDGRIY